MRRQCIDHAVWEKQLALAYWGFMVVGTFIGLFTNNGKLGAVLIGISVLLFVTSIIVNWRHAKWHLLNDKGDDYDYKP